MLRRRASVPLLGAAALLVGLLALASPANAQVRTDWFAPPADSGAAPAEVFLGYFRYPAERSSIMGRRLSSDRLLLRSSDLSGRWWRELDRALAEERQALWLEGAARGPAPPPKRLPPSAVQVAEGAEPSGMVLPDAVAQYADLGLLVNGRGEMGGAWQRFEPCDVLSVATCDQGLTPSLRPDLRFGVLLGGTITDRIHVSVDYDQAREFDAANNINVYYQGLEDEILQRFEMGDVSIVMPQSQYLTGGIPGGNFGFRALAQVGPLELQSVWAQQQGDIGSIDLNIDGRTGTLYEEDEKTIDDHAYAAGRFFFLVDPTQLAGYPHIDILALEEGDAPAAIRPNLGTLQLYHDEQLSPAQQQQQQYRVFPGHAVPPGGDSEFEIDGHFRELEPSDFIVHRSGLWIMLSQPLGPHETLAMSFVTMTGDTVGTVNAAATEVTSFEDAPELRLLRGPSAGHHPEAPTWEYEMHQVYQVFSGQLAPEDLSLTVRLGDAKQGQPFVLHEGQQVPLLRLFGLDETSPTDRLDPERVFLPSELQTGTAAITGTYVAFPTLRPFADPPPTSQLTAAQADAALGDNANHRIYEERDESLREDTRFRMVASYRVRTDGLISQFSLGAFGVREGSERIMVDGVQLNPGTDYTIDYATGTVRLTNPQQLFAGNQSPRITADFERSSTFDIAPKSIFGTTARYRLGQAGDVNLVGFYQTQRSIMSRPELGNEPYSIMMGGVTTNLRFGAGWLDRALDALPGLRLAGESSLGLNGEVAMSLPNPNTRGVAWLDDFEATADLTIPMSQPAWRLGSRPGPAGALGYFPATLDSTNAAGIVWQHQAYEGVGGGMYGAVRPAMIDTTIATVGREQPEAVLYVTMEDNPFADPGERVWRSLTSVLSTRFVDLSTTEYLEFYAAESADGYALVLDLGTVSEDAYFVDSLAVRGTDPVTGEPWGLGVLDREAGYDQPWGIDLDDGLWSRECTAEPGAVYGLGSELANCTANNGLNDTEDLNGDGVPNLHDGEHFRYVVPLGPGSPYLARDRNETGTSFRLYRVPLRGAAALALNGATEQTWTTIRHLRMTITADGCDSPDACRAEVLALARMRLSGSTWKKRERVGVMTGMVGSEVVPGDHDRKVRIGPVSAVTDGSAYIGPPGASDEASDPSQQYGGGGAEVNEKGLRIGAIELEPDARAEVFYRFPAETRSFMEYQELRLWALPRAGDWGPDGTVSLLVKIGTDRDNYYLYRTRLRPPVEHRDVDSRAYWLPEVVIDFEPWFELKAQAETAALLEGDSARVVWNAEGTHAIVLSSRAQAPNLAAIRELSLAIHNDDGLPLDSAEVWINDLRLGNGRSEADFATYLSLNAAAADFANVRLSLSNAGARFQPMNRDATLESETELGLTSRFELGHFAPSGWGLAMPVTVQHGRSGVAPEFLNRTDIRADELSGLRESEASNTQVGVSVSKNTPSPNPWLGLLLDGARLNLNWQSADRTAFTSRSTTSNFNGGLNWGHQLQPRSIDITPDFVVSALRWLAPLAIEQSEFFRRLSSADLRWSPSDLSFSTSYRDQKNERFNYAGVLKGPADSAVVPIRSPQRDLENGVTIGFRPIESLSARLGMSSQRDLLDGSELEASRFGQEAVADVRRDVAGVDLGWERSNRLNGSMQFQPRITSWLRPTVSWTSNYRASRSPFYLDYDTVHAGEAVDTVGGRMLRDFSVDSRLERRLHFDPAGLVRATWGQEPAPEIGFVPGMLYRLGSALLPLELTLSDELGSTFQRTADAPAYGYRFGFGDMREMRFVAGDTAVTATERTGVMMRGGLRLPLDMQLDVTYEERSRDALTGQGASNAVHDRTWPDVRLGITALPIPEAISGVLLRASANAGYRVELTEQEFATSKRDRDAVRVPIQVSLTFAPSISATYTATFGSSESREATGIRRGNEVLHNLQLRSTFDAPAFLQPTFVNPFTASLGYGYTANRACDVGRGIVLPGEEERCAHSIDRLSRDMHVSVETRLNDLNLGAQFSLNEHQSFIGRRDGNREFRLSIFANFNLGIGSIPSGMGTGGMGY